MSSLTQVASMGTATEPLLDQRFAAALSLQAAIVLAGSPDTSGMATEDRVSASRRRTFAWTVLRDPVTVAHTSRWVLAAAPLGLLETFTAGGAAAITDAALAQAADVLWDYLAEA